MSQSARVDRGTRQEIVFIRVYPWSNCIVPAKRICRWAKPDSNAHRRRGIGQFGLSLLVRKAVFVPTGIQAEVFEHLKIFFDGLIEGGQIVANHERAGASHEHQALEIPQINGAATGDFDFLSWQDKAKTSNCFENFEGRQRFVLFEGGAGNGIEDIDGHDVRAKVLERKGEFAAIFTGLAHANNSARTDLDAGAFEMLDGLQALIVSMSRAYLRKESAGALEIMIVALTPGGFE